MPTLTRWYIKSALVWLTLAFTVASALALRTLIDLPAGIGALQPVYFHLLMVGWVTQLIFGVVYWLFPKPEPAWALRSEQLGRLTWLLLNLGLVLRAVSEPAMTLNAGDLFGGLLALSALLQLLAGWLFVGTTWPRVRQR
jgi:hypothetical protein